MLRNTEPVLNVAGASGVASGFLCNATTITRGTEQDRGRGEVDRAGGTTVEGQEGEVEVEAEGSPGQVVAGGRRGAGVEVRGDRVHHEHPYIPEPAASPVGLYAIHQQPQEGPNRDRGEVDRAKGSAKREREEGIGLEELAKWRPRGQAIEEWQPLKRLRLGSGSTGEGAEGYSILGRGVAGEVVIGAEGRGQGAVGIGGQHRTGRGIGQGIVGEVAIWPGWQRERGLGIEEQGRTQQRDRTGIG